MKTLDEQVERLVELGYPAMLHCRVEELRRCLHALQAHVPTDGCELDVPAGKIGFVLVIGRGAAPAETTLPLVVRDGRAAIERLFPREPGFFKPVVPLPSGHAYLLLHVDRGNATLNDVPNAAYASLAAEDRSPLTLEEGIAVLTQFPEFLQPNRCFMMLGSRGNDKRVPALWLSNRQPRLGWCWEGNPHTWLGFASCRVRSAGVAICRGKAAQPADETI